MAELLYLSEDELRKLLSAAREANGYDFTLLLALYELALRASEAAVLRRDEVNWGRRTVIVRVLKRFKAKKDKVTGEIVEARKPPPVEHVSLSSELATVLKKHCDESPTSEWIFYNRRDVTKPTDRSAIKYVYYKYAHKIGLGQNREWHPHILRHTKGTIKARQLTAKKMPWFEQINELKNTLRHADEKTCLQYIHASSEARQVSKEVDEEMTSSLLKSLDDET